MKRTLYLLLPLCAVMAFGASAQTPVRVSTASGEGLSISEEGAPRKLNLEECLDLAARHNRSLAAADEQLKASQYDLQSARANFFPSFSATGTGLWSSADGRLDIPGGALPVLGPDGVPTGASALFPGLGLEYKVGWICSGGISLQQPVYMGGKVRTGYRMARIGRTVAEQQRRLTESEVIVETSQAYAAVVRARELRSVAERYHALLEELLRNVESAYRLGLKPQNDVLRVQVKFNESELNLRRAENGLRLATMNLCHVIGLPLTARVELAESLPEVAEGPLPEADLAARPEHLMLGQKSELAFQQWRMARSERLPQLGLVGNYGYLHGFEVNGQNLLGSWNFTAGVQLSVPIFHFGSRSSKVRAARARYEQARLEQAEGEELMLLELQRAANNLDEARLEIRLAESSLAAAEENLRLSRCQYEVGLESLSDHLEAQAMWQQAWQTQVEARIGGYLRMVEYRKAAGILD